VSRLTGLDTSVLAGKVRVMTADVTEMVTVGATVMVRMCEARVGS
jgi:hypothetical protein